MKEKNNAIVSEILRDLELSRAYLEKNYKEIEDKQSDYLGVFSKNSPIEQRKECLKVYNYAVSNYLSSYSTLIEHMMKARNKLANTELTKKYELKLQSNLTNQQIFGKDLRNYIEHYKLPDVISRVALVGEPVGVGNKFFGFENIRRVIDYSPTLNREDLLKWGGWKKESRVYLKELKTMHNRVHIHSIVLTLHKSILEFFAWFKQELLSLDEAK